LWTTFERERTNSIVLNLTERSTHILVSALLRNAPLVRTQGRTDIAINDTGLKWNLRSSQDGSVYFGSTAIDMIYRATPGAVKPNPD
jgi:hypothetical protein